MMNWKATRRAALTLVVLLIGASAPARADYIYSIIVDTSSLVDSTNNPLSGSQGYLDLQFNPSGGTGTLTAMVQALAKNDTTLGTVNSYLGNVTGPGGATPVSGLPLSLAAANALGPQTNEALLNVTYGNTLALKLTITPADAGSTASFFLSLFDQYGNPLSPNSGGNNPAAVELDLVANPSGKAPTVSSPLLGAGVDLKPGGGVTPEPSSVVLLGLAAACLGGYGCVRRRHMSRRE